MTATEVPRDGRKRPLIVPPDGGDKLIPYGRASGFGKVLEDEYQLTLWKERKTAEGLLRRPDLMTRLAGVIANGDPDTDWPTKRAVNKVCYEAMEAAGASAGASSGTGLHGLTEAVDRDEEPLMPPADQARLDDYRAATKQLTVLDSETFVVCDELHVAGTFDRLWLIPAGFTDTRGYVFTADTVVIGDLKSGKSEADYPLATATQMAIYAHGERYDPDTGSRDVVHEALDPRVGLLVHLPPGGGCQVIVLDLVLGWFAARLAAQVREVQGWKASDLIPGGDA